VEILEIEGEPFEEGDEGSAEDEVGRLRQEIADLRDRSMRTLADFDNYRKRTERERRDVVRYASSEPLRDLLEVVDNLGRALAAADAAGSADDVRTGVEMILRQLEELLRRHGVETISAVGERFDPAVHEAVSRHEDPAAEAPVVVDELQRGYRLHDRLLRPARVVVAVPPEEA
jgi:molecular chaperone GrpE